MTIALLLINFQNDYFANGKLPLEKNAEVCSRAQDVLLAFRNNKMPVIHIQHTSTRPDDNLFLPCTKGIEFHPTMQPTKHEVILKKYYPNSFKDTGLRKYLIKHQIKHLIICGMMTHSSINATVRAAYDFGFPCTVLEDACCAMGLSFNGLSISSQNVHQAFLAALQPLYANVMTVKEFLRTKTVPTHPPIPVFP